MNQVDNSHYDNYQNKSQNFFLLIPLLIFSLLALAAFTISIIFASEGLEGVQVQLQGAVATIPNGDPVIFDTVITDNSPNISYDTVTGEITVTESGTYYIDWWLSADGAGLATTIDLSIVTSTGETITASSPSVTEQITGNALLDITASVNAPVTIQLINTTGDDIFVGVTTVRADLTIVNVDTL